MVMQGMRIGRRLRWSAWRCWYIGMESEMMEISRIEAKRSPAPGGVCGAEPGVNRVRYRVPVEYEVRAEVSVVVRTGRADDSR